MRASEVTRQRDRRPWNDASLLAATKVPRAPTGEPGNAPASPRAHPDAPRPGAGDETKRSDSRPPPEHLMSG